MPKVESAQSPPPALRWGLAGASTMALDYVGPAILAAGHTVAGVCSRSQERARTVAVALGGAPAFPSIEQMLERGELDAVYVSSTNDDHAPQAIAAAHAGVHVLCEKPLAPDLAAAWEIARACEAGGVVLGTNHHLRNAPAHRRVRELIRDGLLGRPLAARLQSAMLLDPQWHGWRLSDPLNGGAILDLTVHAADLLRFVLDDDVTEVTALADPAGGAATVAERAVMTLLRFAGGALASCHDAFTVPNAPSCLEVYGSEAALVVSDANAWQPIATVLLRRDGREERVALPAPENLYERGVQQFAAAVRTGSAPPASGLDGIRSLEVALAARRSAREGTTVTLAADTAR